MSGSFRTYGSQQVPSGSKDRTRRAWSDKEEMFLIGIMKELVATGWKSDNGFRFGYLMKAEESMRRDGVGFNVHGDYKIDVSDDQWSQIVKADGAGHGLRTKSWPYYEDWKWIFGMDRASGITAEDMLDAYNELDPIEQVATNGASLDYDFGLHDFLGGDAGLNRDSPPVMSDNGFSRGREIPPVMTNSGFSRSRN
ncbi:hypothetical protein SASPL_132802 [Salvia splendens]|uniref:Myb/SANT-like domain-containing protein n=1 Tax=Salvia splendens TaxID=180675 RepID=A0A8X8X1L3_SALSN|nr:hypothetical protein SASPL_132802 [Salvia splendens]